MKPDLNEKGAKKKIKLNPADTVELPKEEKILGADFYKVGVVELA